MSTEDLRLHARAMRFRLSLSHTTPEQKAEDRASLAEYEAAIAEATGAQA